MARKRAVNSVNRRHHLPGAAEKLRRKHATGRGNAPPRELWKEISQLCRSNCYRGKKVSMERLPPELCSRIFSRLDHHGLATALQVCRKWKRLATEDALWSRLFADRWGAGSSHFYAPAPDGSKSWKDMYEVQDRCDRIGVGLKIIREGEDYYVVYQGEIQRFLGSRREKREAQAGGGEPAPQEVSEKMLFFLADLETACAHARRTRRRL